MKVYGMKVSLMEMKFLFTSFVYMCGSHNTKRNRSLKEIYLSLVLYTEMNVVIRKRR